MRTLPPLPLPVKNALRVLGENLRKARLRRRIPMDLMARRAMISRTTLTKVEKGDPGVSFGIYATVLFVLGLTSKLATLVDHDELGQILEEENLPKRIRLTRGKNERA